ncbi:transcription repressor NadR [Caldisalinibacter kiritimatiensis]|uniref:Transcriptional repressor for NAD biosynthesis n=1 Tax=Caldisalinibacter kiritimatiensis TaxID=1304284 RepID=R1ATU2_9FIRM|nr:transcription repressor NadR [Caldisalinibacter kiritimatiensis]EOD00533.1 Transcriptional repressor for NAD biosynthesis [Caldisalinibacter kiritimatiensis]
MDANERRENILITLKESKGPIKGTDLAKKFDVSRQVIVQDIAILRAGGEEILATPQGYMIINKNINNELTKTIACRHKEYNEIEDELKTIIDMGGEVLDVIVEHPIYGEIKSPLMIGSRVEIEDFMKEIREHHAEPLATLNDGVHLHTIKVPSEDVFDKIKNKLEEKGYLIKSR